MAKTKTTDEQVLDALSRALADPMPRPLYGTAANPGLFGSSAPAKVAGQRCLDLGLLRQDGEQLKGAKRVPLFSATPKGLLYLLEHAEAPRLLGATLDAVERTSRVVCDCSRLLETLTRQLGDLRQVVQQASDRADPAKFAATLFSTGAAVADSATMAAVTAFVNEQRAKRPPQTCSLAVLFKHLAGGYPNLTIGQMHDALRQLASAKRIRLLPFTQALYQLTEPEYALIVGREVMFYVEAL
jgi:hypothetical protein